MLLLLLQVVRVVSLVVVVVVVVVVVLLLVRVRQSFRQGAAVVARGQRLSEERLHHHRHDGREALEDLDEGDRQVEVGGVTAGHGEARHEADHRHAPEVDGPRHRRERHNPEHAHEEEADDGGADLAGAGEQDGIGKLAARHEVLVRQY